MELNVCICYARKHLRRGAPVDLVIEATQLSDLEAAGTVTTNRPMFHQATENCRVFLQAVVGFASILFGTRHGQAYITGQGYSVHAVALQHLNQALSDAKCYTRDEVILSVVTLAMLETLVPTGPKAYLHHMIGLERLLELRDPGSCPRNSLDIYKAMRHMLVFASLRTGRPSVLARVEWKAALRLTCSEAELEEEELWNVLADCTILVVQRDIMLANWGWDVASRVRQRDKVKRTALDLLDQLNAWKQRWDADDMNFYSETPAAFARLQQLQESYGDESPPFRTVFEFVNEFTPTILMLYNTTLIHVFQVLASLPLDGTHYPTDQTSLQMPMQGAGHLDDFSTHKKDEYIAAERSAALEVCRCLPYYLHRRLHLDSYCSPTAPWASTTAFKTLGGTGSVEGRWIIDLCNAQNGELLARGLWAA